MTTPALFEIEYLAGTTAGKAYLPLAQEKETFEHELFTLQVQWRGNRVCASVTPAGPLRITSVTLHVEHDFRHYERALFNGYQSWTDTHEVPLTARQRGLVGTPRSLVDSYTLDGSGDYRFYDYTGRPGHLHGWTFVYFTSSDKVWMAAGLQEAQGFTLFDWQGGTTLRIMPEPPADTLSSGEARTLCDVVLVEKHVDAQGAGAAIDAAFDAWFDAMDRQYLCASRHVRPLCGYSSWYRHYADISHDKLTADLKATKRVFDMLDTHGFVRVFQVDDGYARVGDWKRLDNCKFPQGISCVAHEIEQAGFMPGLWMAPFVCEQNSQLFATHPEWLLRDAGGNLVKTGSHWSGGYALDTLNPEVRAYVTDCLRTATAEWGFKLLKLDFLYAACMVVHGGKNRGQLMRDALELIRNAVGESVLIDGCGVPLASVSGIVDYCRIGCDVGLTWDGAFYLRATERERVSTKNSLGNTVFRAPLDGRAFGCDPDVVLMRADVDYTPDQRNLLLDGAATCASMLLTSDDPTTWTFKQLDRFQEALDLMRAKFEARNA